MEEVYCVVTTPSCQSVCDTYQIDVKSFEKIEESELDVKGSTNENEGSMFKLLLTNVKLESTSAFPDHHLAKDEEKSIEYNELSSIKVENVGSLYEYVEDSKVWFSGYKMNSFKGCFENPNYKVFVL